MTQCVDFYQRVLARAVDKIFLKKLRFLSMKIGILGPPLWAQIIFEREIYFRRTRTSWACNTAHTVWDTVMFGFPHARLVDDVVKNTRELATSVANTLSDSSISPCKRVRPTLVLLNLATANLRKKENELITLQDPCSSQSSGAQKARASLECVMAYTSSRKGPVGSKLTKDAERPLEYLREVARQYEQEICLCETTLEQLLTRQNANGVGNMNQGKALRYLIAATSQSLSSSKLRSTT